jgi:glycosyltransferase involved in cell wall biosynthesis
MSPYASKQYYVSLALSAKNIDVVWVSMEGQLVATSSGKIPVHRIQTRFRGSLGALLKIGKFLQYCLSAGIRCVYWDDWAFWRENARGRVALQFCLRVLRIKNVQDARDPVVYWELAEGRIDAGSRRFTRLMRYETMSNRLADLILLPSAAYAEAFVERGFSPSKVYGTFRGIDRNLFNPEVNGDLVREKLNLSGKFVIGFVSHFNRYRLIEEVVIPLIERTRDRIPNVFFVAAGFGELEERLREVCGRFSESAVLLEFIPNQQVPKYLAACDVTLSPLDTRFDHCANTVSLKIIESLMLGKPVVATRNRTTGIDFKGLRGVVWVGTDLESFQDALAEVASNFSHYSAIAKEQAMEMEQLSTETAIPAIADKVIEVCCGRRSRLGTGQTFSHLQAPSYRQRDAQSLVVREAELHATVN